MLRLKVEKSSKTCKARGMNTSDAQPIKILIVDDEAGVRELLKDALKLAGFETLAANDGMSALTALRSYTPDIMIIDINMPFLTLIVPVTKGLLLVRFIKASCFISSS